METSPLTLILNPNARAPRRRLPSEDQLRTSAGPRARVHLTRDLGELDDLVRDWSLGDGTLCFYGGDGSIARGITALVRQGGSLPVLLPVRAGTINVLCNWLGIRESPGVTLERWRRGELRDQVSIPTLKVEVEGCEPIYGFLLAWGVGYRMLREYYGAENRPTAVDAVRVLVHAFARSLHPRASELPVFRAEALGLRVDGAEVAVRPLHSLIVGTVPRTSLGMRPLSAETVLPGRFHYSGNGLPMWKVARHAPTVIFGRGDPGELGLGDRLAHGQNASRLEAELSEGFTLDGEMVPIEGRRRVVISGGPVVRFWCGGPGPYGEASSAT